MLAKTIQEDQRNWDLQLQKAIFAYRVSINETTGFTPFLITFGRSPQLPVDVMFGVEDAISDGSVATYVRTT
jgi:hypothetical protein